MTCYHPLPAYPPPDAARDRRPVFAATKSYEGARPISLPCYKCEGCLKARSRAWMLRMVHERRFHERACFVTLTFDDAHLPVDGAVRVHHHQHWMRRLRRMVGPARFFGCGEYGDVNRRPHLHTILFGLDFADDRVPADRGSSGELQYVSATLSEVWPYGRVTVGDATPSSMGYVARYVNKKVAEAGNPEAYRRVNLETGEVWYVPPPFVVMSRRPGIGDAWFEKFRGDVFPSDFVVHDGTKFAVPRYYSERLARSEEGLVDERLRVSARRKAAVHVEARKLDADAQRLGVDVLAHRRQRLETREECDRLRSKRLVRPL